MSVVVRRAPAHARRRSPSPRRSSGGWRSALAPLFPEAPPLRAVSRPRLVSGYAAGFLAATLVAYFRQSGTAPARTLWAEDGVIFYSQALSKGLGRDLASAYNGYDQIVPRLGGELARLVPVADVPVVMAWGGAALLGLLCCLVFHMARGHVPSPAGRLVLAASMPLLPVAIVEMLDNWVNVPWWMFFATFWALLWRPARGGGRWAAGVLCALSAASEPLVGLLVPLAAVRVLALPSRRENAAPLGLAAGLVFQGVVVVGGLGRRTFDPKGGGQLVPDFFERVGLGWLTGLRGTDWVASGGRALAVALGASAVCVVAVVGLTAAGRSVRALTLAVIVLAPLCFIVPVWLRGVASQMQAGASVGFAGRYAATPMLMVLSVVLAAAGAGAGEGRVRRRRSRAGAGVGSSRGRQPLAVVACAAALVPAWAVDFRDANARSRGPAWGPEVAAATSSCASRPAAAPVSLPIDPPGMSVVLRCSDLERQRAGERTRTSTPLRTRT